MSALGRRFRLAAPIALVVSFASLPALADMTKDQCIDANGKGQDLRRDGKLSAAREQLRMCADSSCPAMVRDDCTKRLDDLEKAQPTIAFEVKDASGADVSHVKVSVEGKPLADRLDGTALPVDVGEHVFTFEVAGQTPVTRTFVLTEGEKGRRERIAIGTAPSPASPSPAAAPLPEREANAPAASATISSAPEPASTSGGIGTRKILGLVAGGAGVVGIAVGSVFGVMTISEKSQQQTDCANPACTSTGRTLALNDHQTGMTYSTISTVGFIAGGALLVGGAVLFFAARHASEPSAVTGMLILPSAGPGGGGVFLRGKF